MQVIPYGDSHEALWETLEAWAERADNPTAWRSAVVKMSGSGPRGLASYQRGMVAHLVRTSIGAKDSNRYRVADFRRAQPLFCMLGTPCKRQRNSRQHPKQFADAKPAPPAEWLCVFDVFRRYANASYRLRTSTRTAFDPLEEYGLDDDPPRPRRDEKRDGWPSDDLISWRRGDDSVDHWQRLVGVSWSAGRADAAAAA